MNIHKFTPVNKADVFHTHGHAKAAQGASIGAAAAASTFESRQQLAKQRQVVAGYNRSTIGSSYGVQRAKQVQPGGSNSGRGAGRSAIGSNVRQAHNAKPSVAMVRFTNPQSRGYNPYA